MNQTPTTTTVAHPSWCARNRCTVPPDSVAGVHMSDDFAIGRDGEHQASFKFYLYQTADATKPPIMLGEFSPKSGVRRHLFHLSSRQAHELVRALVDLLAQR